MPKLHLLSSFSHFVEMHSVLAYGVLFLGVFIEGEFVLILAGILVHLHVLKLGFTIATIIIAAAAKTTAGYSFGRYLGRKFPNSRVLRFFERRVFFFLPRFKEKPFWSIFISKFVYGLNNATLVFSGYIRVKFKQFVMAESLASFIWLTFLFTLGIFFSSTALAISHNLRHFMLVIGLFVVGFIILQKSLGLVVEIVEEWGLKEDEDRIQ